jgi:DNA-directed RNA polymerase specialized sigma24 family protein
MSDCARLSADELETLWREAWRLARQACHTTLIRLRAGHGGFYDADDLHQDLFLGFRSLALEWAAETPRPPESALWAAWRRRLWHGGARYYRRRPQRLWARVEIALPPEILALDDADDAEARDSGDRLPADVIAQLVQSDEATAGLEGEDTEGELAAALSLLPREQQRLLKAILRTGSVAEAARALGLPQGQRTYQRLYRARRALQRALQERKQVVDDGP